MRDYEQTIRELRDPQYVYHYSRDYLKNMMDDAADAIEDLEAAVEGFESTTDMAFVEEDGRTVVRFVPKWISVEDRLPKYGDWVLGIGPKKGYYICEYRGVTHFPYEGDIPWFAAKGRHVTVTHWMPLPEAPREVSTT